MIEMPIGSIRPNKMYLGLGADEDCDFNQELRQFLEKLVRH